MSRKQATRFFWTTLAAIVAIVIVVGTVHAIDRRTAPATHYAPEAAATPAPPVVTAEGRALLEQFSAAFEGAAAKVNPSVVPILSEQKVTTGGFPFGSGESGSPFGEDFLRRFFNFPQQPQEQTLHSLGSGVIIRDDGYILTNHHVVQNADKVTVMIGQRKQVDARVIGSDPETDLAVIKVDADGLEPATLGNSDDLRVGQWVIAVGNPLEMLHSVTAGIISAMGRSSVGLADYEDFIQTDASINPGNSGGALADLDGRVIGINTAIASPSGGNVGIGFAIPINLARSVMDDLILHGKITRGYLGLLLQNLNQQLAQALGLESTRGALVGQVVQGGPADEAGVRRGDVIVGYDGRQIDNSTQLRNLVAADKPGTHTTLRVLRNGRETDLEVTLGQRPADVAKTQSRPEEQQAQGRLGLSVSDLTPQLAQHFGYQNAHGVVVTGVDPESPADDAGLQPGDLIEQVGSTEIRSTDDLRQALSGLRKGESVALLIRRGDATFFVAVNVP